MFNLQGSEIIVILLLALVVLGPEKLPGAVRRFTQTYNELKKMGNGFQSELRSAIDEPMREMRNTADLFRDAADPSKLDQQQRRDADDRPDGAQPDDARPSDGEPTGNEPVEPPSRPSTPVVAPPGPFASASSLGRPLPEPEGLPSLDLPPPARRRRNGHARPVEGRPGEGDAERTDAPSLPPPRASR